MLLIIILMFGISSIVYCILKIQQLEKFTEYVEAILTEENQQIMELIQQGNYHTAVPLLDITKSYQKFDKLIPLSRNFNSCAVYKSQ